MAEACGRKKGKDNGNEKPGWPGWLQGSPWGQTVQTLKAYGCHLLLVDPVSGECLNQPHSNRQEVSALFVSFNRNESNWEVVPEC